MASPPTPLEQTRDYYDRFAPGYERERHHGYHRMIDALELGLIRRYGTNTDVFEAGCGTGLLLREVATFARRAVGLDLSRRMLAVAAKRNLEVVQGSLTHVPLPDASFDLVYSMKVLPHVQPIQDAVRELARIVRPGGHLLLEFYNPRSLRYLAKRLGGPAPIAAGTTDRDVYTRYDTLDTARRYLPTNVELMSVRGVRIFTPVSTVFRVPGLGTLFSAIEHATCDMPVLRGFGGFLVLVARKK